MANRIDDYKKELDGIEASEGFKHNTKMQLLAALDEEAAKKKAALEAAESRPTPPRKAGLRWLRPALAAAAIVLVSVVGLRAVLGTRSTAGYAQSAMGDMPAAAEAADDAGADYDEAAPAMESAESYMTGGLDGYFSKHTQPGARSGLPSVSLGEMNSLDSGYQGLLLYSFDEYSGLLLGEEGAPATLPVYRNEAQRGTAAAALEGREEAVEEIGMQQAAALGLQVEKIVTVYGDSEDYMELECDAGTITVYTDETVVVWFSQPRSVGSATPKTQEEWQSHAQSAVDSLYPLFAGMRNPETEVLLDRTAEGEALWYVTVFDAGEGLADRTENRSLRAARLAFDENGALTGLRLWRKDVGESMGSYPTLSLDEATAALAAGHALTTVPYAFPGTEHVAGADLVYLATGYEECYLPFYLFYVRLPEEQVDGAEDLEAYGAWYVPALRGEYVNGANGQPFFS